MNYARLKELVTTLDPQVREFAQSGLDGQDMAYTVITPHNENRLISDDMTEDRILMVTIDRYAKDSTDDLHRRIVDLLDKNYFTVADVITTYDPEDQFIRHIIDVYVTA